MASGIPPATIYWVFEGEIVNETASTSTIELSDDVFLTTSVLKIMSVQRSDAGMYTCIATNGVPPNSSTVFNLTLNCKHS